MFWDVRMLIRRRRRSTSSRALVRGAWAESHLSHGLHVILRLFMAGGVSPAHLYVGFHSCA